VTGVAGGGAATRDGNAGGLWMGSLPWAAPIKGAKKGQIKASALPS
jgi:hypothetical protein